MRPLLGAATLLSAMSSAYAWASVQIVDNGEMKIVPTMMRWLNTKSIDKMK